LNEKELLLMAEQQRNSLTGVAKDWENDLVLRNLARKMLSLLNE